MKTILTLLFAFAILTACQNAAEKETESIINIEDQNLTDSDLNLSAEAQKGKAIFAICLVCHDTELDSTLAPPMRNIQKRYKFSYPKKEVFIEKIAEHTKAPTKENSIMMMAVKTFGVMPALPLSDEYLHNIGSYIYEGEFPFPCKHMKAEIAKDPDSKHAKMMQKMLDENCED